MKDLSIVGNSPAKKDEKGNVVGKALTATITVKAPESAAEAIKEFGDEAVNSNATAKWVVTLQGNIRSALRKGEDPIAIAKRLGSSKMGVAATGGTIDPQAAFIAKFKTATPEEQAKMIKELKSAAAE